MALHYIFYHGDVTPSGVRNIEALLLSAFEVGVGEVTLCLASNGGDVTAGVGLYNFIGMLPMTVNTHAAGQCGSIAATIFMAGQRRTASPMSGFLTHGAVYSEGPFKDQPAPTNWMIAEPFKEKLGWSDEQIAERFGPTDYRLTPQAALDAGLIAEIINIRAAANDSIVSVRID